MTTAQDQAEPMRLAQKGRGLRAFFTPGTAWLALACLGAALFFWPGLVAMAEAWQQPEYSHGPLIPVLSAFLFLRHLKHVPAAPGPVPDRWPGLAVIVLALGLGGFGRLIQIDDFAAYGLILWVGGLLLISFGWQVGRQFWPPVLHLVYMLPLPGVLYYGLSTNLQLISSELGVSFLRFLDVPVFLDGNIIDLGVFKLHVAEACSGLRYLFPILSFSYIFAVLYRGPMWHKAVLLVSAVPITVLMNSVRIAIAGVIVNNFGLEHLEGFSHFFEGWVIFLACVLILFALAWLMLRLRRDRMGLAEALDLDTTGLGPQAARLRFVAASRAMVLGAVLVLGAAAAWQAVPSREAVAVGRDPFVLFPRRLNDWVSGPPLQLDQDIEAVLAADDYHAALFRKPGEAAHIDLFVAWYEDQLTGGTHSPEVCIPGAGWEIAELKQIASPVPGPDGAAFTLNRAIIQKGVSRMLVYYWFDQQGSRTASAFAAKWNLTLGKIRDGRNDGALVRLITPINPGEEDAIAEARLNAMLANTLPVLPRFVPD